MYKSEIKRLANLKVNFSQKYLKDLNTFIFESYRPKIYCRQLCLDKLPSNYVQAKFWNWNFDLAVSRIIY